jgi:hypothetical protein
MLSMSTAPAPRSVRRVVLLPSTQRNGRGDELIRRYRLARLRLEERHVSGAERFDHLKRRHD